MPSNEDLDRLSGLAEKLQARPEWRVYAEFAAYRGRGLRDEALRSLDRFIAAAICWPFDEKLEFCLSVLRQTEEYSLRELAFPSPLRAAILVPSLTEWLGREPNNAEAHLWLGLLRCDDPSKHLVAALEFDPSCERARRTLVEWLTGDVEYNQHELPAFYIHDPREDLTVLDQADALVAGGSRDAWTVQLAEEIAELRRLALDWLKIHPGEGDFAAY
jgi:hypothetical protein